MKKFAVVLILIIGGASVANLSNMVSITSEVSKRNSIYPIYQEHDRQPRSTDYINDFGYNIVEEIDQYFRKEADSNKIKISATVYSTGLLYEIGNSLIIIGHGYNDSNNQQYYIADYSSHRIHLMAENKDYVALLACYSNNIIFQNGLTLTYDRKIDLKTAVNDLFIFFSWNQQFEFNPTKNIMLFELDSGEPGGLIDAPYSNGIKYAYSGWNGYHYWNLNTEAGFLGVGNWMLINKEKIVKVYIANAYYVQIDEHSYELISGITTFDAWVLRKSDMNDYIHMENFVIDGEANRKKYEEKLNSIRDILFSDEFIVSFLASVLGGLVATIPFTLITIGIGLINKGRLAAETILITVTALGESILGLNAGPYLLTIPSVNTILIAIGVTLIIIAVLFIAGIIIYCFYRLS